LQDDYIAGVGGDLTIGGSRAIGIINNVWWFVGYGSSTQDYQSGISVNFNRWSQVTYTWNNTTQITASVNGVFEKVIRTGLVTPTGVNFTLGRPPWNDASSTWGGNLSKVQFYPKALTESEMLQNYYGGPIVTGSLLFAIDAGNLVSYPKSGTSAYNLTGSGAGTLTNGVGYNNIYDGTFNFDGADDYINLGQINYTNVTVEGWVFREDTTDLVNIVSGAGVVQYFSVYSQTLAYYASTNTGTWTFGTTTLQPQTWYHVALTYDNSDYSVKMYLNGNLESTSTADASYRTGYVSTLGTYNNASIRFWKGYISNLRIYGAALTQAQIQQNYNATK
jgi:hypothetical protein